MPSASVALTEERFSSVRTPARSPALTASMSVVPAPAACRLAADASTPRTNQRRRVFIRLDGDAARADAELVHLAVVLVGDRDEQVRERRFLGGLNMTVT